MVQKLPKKTSVRLSKSVVPVKYTLQIQPDMEAFTFVGNEVIDLILEKSIKEITIHSKDLEITDGWWQVGKTKIDISKTTYNEKSETATFTFAKSLPKGKGKLHLHFRGIILESLRGFYRSQYVYKGKQMRIATTQFEATDARRAFPCFDEPAQKAVFEVSLIIPKHLTAISNTVESATPHGIEHNPGFKVVKFTPTPKMSTYLLAYIVGDFEYVETKTKGKNGVRIRLFTTPGKKHQTQFALDVAKRSLEFLNDYFKIPYPLPVLDLIAIPDFSAGAMENWGAVTFRESALLLDEKHTAFANRQNIAYIIAHELVHQWFGNLVTMEWWTHLWLNESFATFMGYIAIDDLFPEWKIWTKFVMHDHSEALELDSLENTHPVEVEVHHPNQISEIFDAISYEKGGSILRMLMHYIGPVNFRNGLVYYLKKHSYKNTESIHLWEAFEKISKKPVKKFMKNWISKPGYPMITVKETKTGKLELNQVRFSLNNLKDKTKWLIPFQFEYAKGKISDVNLLAATKSTAIIPKAAEYIKTNPQETGFYRTLYSPTLLAKLYEPIRRKELSVEDRFGVVRDVFAMVKAGHIPTSAYLELIKAYKAEDSYIVWSEILNGMGEIYNLQSGDIVMQKQLAKYYRKLLKEVAELVGWKPEHKETQTRGLLRSAILSQYGNYGDESTVKKARQLFVTRTTKPIHPDLRATIYTLSAIDADIKTLNILKKMYTKETLNEEQRRIGRALIAIKNPKLFQSSLDFALTSAVRSQDAPIMIALGTMLPNNKDTAWKWLQKNWATLESRYHDDHLIVWIVKSLSGFSTKEKYIEVEKFFTKHPVPSAQRAIKQVLEKIDLQIAWRKRDRKDLADYLKQLHK